MAEAVFEEVDEGRYRPTELGVGPWDPGALHGGAPAALLMGAFERLPSPDGLLVTRVTYELLRPVPVAELVLKAEVVRPGKRVQLLEGSLSTADGTEVVRARALRIRQADLNGAPPTEVSPPPPGPEAGEQSLPAQKPPHQPTFFPAAIEIRFVEGAFGGGPSTGWFRLRVPVVAGQDTTPLQLLAAAGDFGNGISTVLPWDRHLFINPDLTLYMDRPPVGEWIALEARTLIPPEGVGTAESVLYDERGRVGRAIQSLLIASR